jgi:hypothetical protein
MQRASSLRSMWCFLKKNWFSAYTTGPALFSDIVERIVKKNPSTGHKKILKVEFDTPVPNCNIFYQMKNSALQFWPTSARWFPLKKLWSHSHAQELTNLPKIDDSCQFGFCDRSVWKFPMLFKWGWATSQRYSAKTKLKRIVYFGLMRYSLGRRMSTYFF